MYYSRLSAPILYAQVDDENYLVPSPQSPEHQQANTPTSNNCKAYLDLNADPGAAPPRSASSVKGPDTMFQYPPPPGYLVGGANISSVLYAVKNLRKVQKNSNQHLRLAMYP